MLSPTCREADPTVARAANKIPQVARDHREETHGNRTKDVPHATHRDGGGRDGGGGDLLPAANFCERHGAIGCGHCVADCGHRHVHARAGVPVAGRAQAGSRRGRVCLCQGRLRRLPRLSLGLRLLDRQLHRQRVLLGADQVHAGRLLPSLRGRQHGRCHRRRLGRHLALPLHDPQGRAAGRLHQQRRHRREDHPYPGFHRHPDLRLQDGPVPGNLYGGDLTGSIFEQVRATMLVTVFVFLGIEGASVYSRYAKEALRRRQGHHPRLHRRHRPHGAGHDAALRRAAAREHRRHAPALHGCRPRSRRRPVGRRLRQCSASSSPCSAPTSRGR